ncbi:MAG: M14 family metallopeptidase [Myxococcota bacterium]
MQIDDHFEGGNIEVIDASDPGNIRLALRPDPPTETPEGTVRYRQWFHFRITGVRDVPLTLHLEDAAQASYPRGWEGYRAVCSTDHYFWRRAETTYDEGRLTIRVTPDADVVWLAYFAPYDLERLQGRIGAWCRHPTVRLRPLCRTPGDRPLDRLIVGDPGRTLPVVWILARQHPGESMASWWVEGLLRRLLDDFDALAARLRSRASFHVVPMMNPDGAARGYIRTNALGVDLNRVWDDPPSDAPEVAAVLHEMDRTGVHACLDVHGESDLPYSFASNSHAMEAHDPRVARHGAAFCDAYQRANPDFQQEHGYPPEDAETADFRICKNAVSRRFDCFATTLEMPFKHNVDLRDHEHGWSPPRCRCMGAAALDGLHAVIDAIQGG